MISALMVLLIYVGGVVTCLGPCSLAMIPAYLTYIAGSAHKLWQGVTSGIAFTLGLAIVFSALGAAAALVGVFLPPVALTYAVLGVMMMIFGVVLLGFFQRYACRLVPVGKVARFTGFFGALALGMSFGLVWTPCVTPALAAVLILVTLYRNLIVGGALLFVFALGHGTPLIIAGAVLAGTHASLAARLEKASRWLTRLAGVFLIVLGADLMLPLFGYPTILFRILTGGIGP